MKRRIRLQTHARSVWRSHTAHFAVVLAVTVCVVLQGELAASATTRWTIVKTPTYAGGSAGQLEAISCPAVKSCFAVGYGGNRSGSGFGIEQPLIEHWDGTQWWELQAPIYTREPRARLVSISCTSDVFCMAVGSGLNSASTTSLALAERWNGHSWSVVPTVDVGGSVLTAVACAGPLDCSAVGYSAGTSGTEPLIEHYSGGGFSLQVIAHVTQTVLTSISCTKTGYCEAAGYSNVGGTTRGRVVSSPNGRSWTEQAPLPNFPGSSSGIYLKAIACTGASACLVVGLGSDGTTVTGISEQKKGSKWTLVKAAKAGGAHYTALSAVTCASSSDCIAVGYNVQSSSDSAVERWDGTRWAVVPSQIMPIYPASQLDGVSCRASSCVAAGFGSGPSSNATAPLVERS